MVTLQMLLSELAEYVSPFSEGHFPTREFTSIYLVDEQTKCLPGILYLGQAEQAARLLIRGDSLAESVIFVDRMTPDLTNAPTKGELIISTGLSLTAMYNRLNPIFEQARNWHHRLSMESNSGLFRLLQTADTMTGVHFSLFNADHLLIADSVEAPTDGVDTRRPLQDRHIGRLWHEEQFHAVLGQMEPFEDHVLSQRENGNIYAVTRLRNDTQVLGYLFAYFDGKRSILQSILSVITSFVLKILNEKVKSAEGKLDFQNLSMKLFSSSAEDLQSLEFELRRLPLKPRRYLRGVVIRKMKDDGSVPVPDHSELNKFFRQLCRLFSNDNVALIDDVIYLLLSADNYNVPVQLEENEAFCSLLEEYGAFAMVTHPGVHLLTARVMYFQALQLMPIAVNVRYQTTSRCLSMDHYSPFYAIYLCDQSAQSAYGIDDIVYLCHPGVLTLTRYDRAYDSNLRDTLYTYLMNNHNISETSRQLFMHRNTTIYKINKIGELTGCDLNDPHLCHQLVLSCMIIRYLEEYRGSGVDLSMQGRFK